VSTEIVTLQLVSDMSQGSLRFPGLPVSTKLVIVQFGAALWVTIVKSGADRMNEGTPRAIKNLFKFALTLASIL